MDIISHTNTKLVVFDMDGLMVDSELIFLRSCNRTFKNMGIFVPDGVIIGLMGRTKEDFFEIFTQYLNKEYTLEEFWDYFNYERAQLLKEEPVKAKKGIHELIEYLDNHNIKRAIASSSDLKRIKDYLTPLNLFDGYEFIINGDMVNKGKPNPEIYLKCLELGGYKKEEVLVFEDSLNGLLSSYNAGIRCVLVPDIAIVPLNQRDKAEAVIHDLSEAIPLLEEGKL